jgi:hypothetical protein
MKTGGLVALLVKRETMRKGKGLQNGLNHTGCGWPMSLQNFCCDWYIIG